MKRILVISWYFPPVNSSEGLITFKLLKNSKYEYDVFTQNKSTDWAYNNTETKLISNNINPIFSDSENISEWVKDGINYYINNKDKYDVIMTRSMAPESHEIGLAIKRINPNIIWLASFGDPISNNPYQLLYKKESPYQVKGKGMLEIGIKRIISPKRILMNMLWNYRTRKYLENNTRVFKDIELQDNVLKEADKIIFNSSYQRDYMLDKYNDTIKNKGIILPHTFDEDFYNNKKVKDNKKIVMSYIGHCDEIRSPKLLFDAIKRLKNSDKDLSKKLEVNFYGNLSMKDKATIIDNEIVDIVKVHKNVSYFESLDIMKNSNCLLLVDANLSTLLDNNIFFAAKLADYLGAERPIFGITMYNGPSADILRKTNNIISTFSVDEIYMNLKRIVENKIDFIKYDNYEYNAKSVAKLFDNCVKSLIGDKND